MNATKILLAAASLAALAACSDAPVTGVRAPERVAPVRMAPPATAIEGSYIVVLKEGADPRRVAGAVGARPRHVYEVVLNGFAGELSPGQLRALQHNPHVDHVEQDQTGTVDATQYNPPWGLDRIDQRGRVQPFGGTYTYYNTGAGVRAYVLDTGIDTWHPEFGGRASVGFDALGGSGRDCHGHGTHVAGIIGSATYGVAKQVRLVSVRVARCDGTYDGGDLIAGVDWVARNAIRPAVANLSLGGGYRVDVNNAVTSLSSSGVFVAVSAGNETQNACNRSPASATAVTTVAASDMYDRRASYSNYGSCVDLYAPGSSIRSTTLGGFTQVMSGTSMASPHVAGVVAIHKGLIDSSQSGFDSWLKSNATPNAISDNPSGTPNLLLYKTGL